MKRFTAALLCCICMTATAQAENRSAEFYGGTSTSAKLKYGVGHFKMDTGTIFGLGAYRHDLVKGLDLGLGLMATSQGYTGFTTSLRSTSIMANARYNFALGPTADANVGLINVTYDGQAEFPSFTGSQSIMGGQIDIGLRYNLANGTSIFVAIKHQRAFDDVTIKSQSVGYNCSNVIIGTGMSC